MPNTLFAVLLGLLAAYGAYAGMRNMGSRSGTGWLIIAAGAAIQTLNLTTGYSTPIAIGTTLAILVGAWMTRGHVSPV